MVLLLRSPVHRICNRKRKRKSGRFLSLGKLQIRNKADERLANWGGVLRNTLSRGACQPGLGCEEPLNVGIQGKRQPSANNRIQRLSYQETKRLLATQRFFLETPNKSNSPGQASHPVITLYSEAGTRNRELRFFGPKKEGRAIPTPHMPRATLGRERRI